MKPEAGIKRSRRRADTSTQRPRSEDTPAGAAFCAKTSFSVPARPLPCRGRRPINSTRRILGFRLYHSPLRFSKPTLNVPIRAGGGFLAISPQVPPSHNPIDEM